MWRVSGGLEAGRPRQFSRAGCVWYAGDAFVGETMGRARLLLFHPGASAARVAVRFFFVGRPPREVRLRVEAGGFQTLELDWLPRGEAVWVAVEAEAPVLPQLWHAEFAAGDPVPDALIAPAPYPGPLEDETLWSFPDGYVSPPDGQPWHETETLTLLNPGLAQVTARLTYAPRLGGRAVRREARVAGERVAVVETEAVRGDYALRVEASGPVVCQLTRRARWRGRPEITGARGCIGAPGAGRRVWHHAGGAIVGRGLEPKNRPGGRWYEQSELGWNLLFAFNPARWWAARGRLEFHHEAGLAGSAGMRAPAGRSGLAPLQAEEFLTQARALVDRPWGVTLRTDRPVIAAVCNAEYEMWSRMNPGAMCAVHLYPGPLTDETVWWLGLGREEGPGVWERYFHFLNPGSTRLEARLELLGTRRRQAVRLELEPGACRWWKAEPLEEGEAYAAVAEADSPFIAQAWTRVFTPGQRHVRAMYSNLGHPMRLRP